MRKSPDYGTLVCGDCGRTTLKRNGAQLYCAACSGERDRKRKAEWGRRHGHVQRRDPQSVADRRSLAVEVGAHLSAENRASLAWASRDIVDLPRKLRVAVPFDWAFSKNAVWRQGRGGHVFARKEAVAAREGLAAAIRRAGETFYEGRLYVDIFVEKPSHKGDAINVIDLVCDAIKDATGVDDRWYSILAVDWSIVKRDPRIIVGVGQAIDEPHRCCAHCGRDFPARSKGRLCADCGAPKRTAKRLGLT